MQTPHTYCYSRILFAIFYPNAAKLEEAEAPRFMKNASASGSSKSQMFPSLLPLQSAFFKVLPLPQKFNRFRFHISGCKM